MGVVARSRSYASCIRDITASMLKTHPVNESKVDIFNVIIHLKVIQSGQLRNPGLNKREFLEYQLIVFLHRVHMPDH